MFWGPWADGQSTRDQITSDRRSSRGDEWSIKIFNCSQNLNECSLARALLASSQFFYFCSCSQKIRSAPHARKDHLSPLQVRSLHPWILSGNSSECWLHTCDACVITTWRSGFLAPLVDRKNGHLSKTDNGHFWNRQLLLWKIPQKGNEVFSTWQ